MPLAAQAIPRPRRPMLDDIEVHALIEEFGEPVRRFFTVPADGSLYTHRFRRDPDRRAEVVFVIQGPGDKIWLHTKHSYPAHIFRLPSGGIEWQESVYEALIREIKEETGLYVRIGRFLGLITYRFYPKEEQAGEIPYPPAHYDDDMATSQFASYIFLVHNYGLAPQSHDNDEVAEFRAILPCQLPHVANDLRNTRGERRTWGYWRALAHDLVYETLC